MTTDAPSPRSFAIHPTGDRPVFAHFAVLVSDIERSSRFYEQVFGWTPLFEQRITDELGRANGVGGPGRVRMGEVQGIRMQLVQMDADLPPAAGPDRLGVFLFSVVVNDSSGIPARAIAAGGTVRRLVNIMDTPLLVLADPDGQEVGITCRDGGPELP